MLSSAIEFARIKTRYKFIANVEKTGFKVSEVVSFGKFLISGMLTIDVYGKYGLIKIDFFQ